MTPDEWVCSELIVMREPPINRQGYCAEEDGGVERHFTEAAVMLSVAMHMFQQGAALVRLHPDGEHAKRFEIAKWLANHGFKLETARGSTTYGGEYSRSGRKLIVHPSPGVGDVVGVVGNRQWFVECKGGIINSTHAGVSSKLRKGLCELVGQLLSKPEDGSRQIAVIPFAPETMKLAKKMAARVRKSGVEICLVKASGELQFVTEA